MIKVLKLFFVLMIPFAVSGQHFTSYFTGNKTDVVANPSGGICMMGGATENDEAMKWFLRRANGGDVLVLRASGSNGYNRYMYSELGVTVNSVESIVCDNRNASFDAYVLQKISQAEAIWFAGGDQWDYVSFWRNSLVDSLINQRIHQQNIVIGGTSAGMAILGKYYFSAKNGTVSSVAALTNPYNKLVTVDSARFIKNRFLEDVITDTHFDEPDRRGRLVAFLARISVDFGIPGKAIACDEYTSVCIDTDGTAFVFGGYPGANDNAYFIQSNCGLPTQKPEICISNTPLTWNRGEQALKVYRIKGTHDGSRSFDLNDWKTGRGGEWLDWSVNTGVFTEKSGDSIDCKTSSSTEFAKPDFVVFPNPASDKIFIASEQTDMSDCLIVLQNMAGQKPDITVSSNQHGFEIDVSRLSSGIYFLTINDAGKLVFSTTVIKN